MRALLIVLAVAFIAGCGDAETTVAGSSASVSGSASASPAPSAASATTPKAGLGERTGELVNPDESTMVFLYYHLAGMTPPINDWVEEDNRVRYAQPLDRPAKRTAVRSELEAAAAAVRGIGFIYMEIGRASCRERV